MIDFHYHCPIDSPKGHFIDMTLEKEGKKVCLRFTRPGDLKISNGFPTQLGLFLSDITRRGWEDRAIEIGDFENDTIHFYASDVELRES